MLKKYEGRPCKKCSGTLRYSSSRRCVQCQAEDSSTRYSSMTKRVQELEELVASLTVRVQNLENDVLPWSTTHS